jgi:CDP-diacylglycerol--glycerol-3-phosphate 3-phosphatidyltransferase
VSTGFGPSALATPANAVTLVRVLLLPPLVMAILAGGPGWGVLTGWVTLTSSDLLDGWLARRHGTTRSGAFLDPLADKILVLGAMTALVAVERLSWVPVSLIATREVLVSAYRSYVGRRGVSVPARVSGKVKTWAQAIAVGLLLAPVEGRAFEATAEGVLWLAVVITLVTGARYLIDGRQVIRAL